MNRYAIYHKPESNFAYAVNNNEIALILKVAANDKPDGVEILYNNKYDFTKSRATAQMTRCACDGLFAYYRADIKVPDARLAYIFRITEKGKVYYFSEEGLSEDYDFKLAYYTFFQFAFVNAADVMPVVKWTENAVFYQIFIDRFARGDFEKDDKYINTKWNEDIGRYSFTGGDLEGIESKLDFLKETGVTALYLTPIFQSDTNHKYNIKDYLKVDEQFGGNKKLSKFLSAAHAAGFKVIIDCVFNHCDISHEKFKDVAEKGRGSQYYDWFLIDGDFPDVEKGNYAHFADCRYMPKWNTSNPQTRRYLIDVALKYLEWGFDGLRLDVADEVSHEMWRQIRREVKESYPQALILGEIWHLNEHWLRGDQFDGVMNYKLQKILADYFGVEPISAKQAADRMNALLFMNTEQANSMALNFLDNHDTPRFFRFAGGNCDKLLCALCAMMVFPGIPCVFYGTELPLDGAGDPDCRKTFDWTFAKQDKSYFNGYKQILALKRQTALSGGNAVITAENGILKIERSYGGETICAYFNTCGRAKNVGTDGEVLFALNAKDGKISNNGVIVVKNKS